MTVANRRKHTVGYIVLVLVAIVTVSVCLYFIVPEKSSNTDDLGKCGDELTWTYSDSSNTLIISGTGDMYDYGIANRPWAHRSSDIEMVLLPEGLTHIGRSAFSDFISLRSLTIPDTVRSIGDGALSDCRTLRSVSIPGSVISIGTSVFDGCSGLMEIAVDPANPSYSSEEGILYDKDKTSLILCPIGTQLKTVSMPDSVTTVFKEAFSGCGSLVSMYLPCNVKTIHEDAFKNCRLRTLCNYSDLDIRPGEYGLPDSVLIVREEGPCTEIADVCGDGLEWRLSKDRFTLTISGTGDIYDYGYKQTPWYRYSYCIGNVVLKDGLAAISDFAFSDFSLLETITVPDTVETIGEGAFAGCISLTAAKISNSVKTLNMVLFNGCTSLSAVNLPDSLIEIADYVFRDCTALSTVNIPRYVETIGVAAFGYSCIKKVHNYSVLEVAAGQYGLQSDVTVYSHRCGKDLMWDYDADSRTLTVTGSGEMKNYTGRDSPWYDFNGEIENVLLPDGLTNIGNYAFINFTRTSSIAIPNTVKTIGIGAFFESKALTSFFVPDSVVTIKDWAFHGCSSLASVTISLSVTSIGEGTFIGCSALTDLFNCSKMNISANQYGLSKNVKIYSSKCGNNLVWKYDEGERTLTVAGSGAMNDYARSEAPWYSSSGDIENIVLSNGITHIGDHAFYNLCKLGSVTVPAMLASIGDDAFCLCGSLTSVHIPASVVAIGTDAFFRCSNLEEISVDPENGEFSSENGILYDRGRTMLILCPNSLPRTSVTVPGSVETICGKAFFGCGLLRSVAVPEGVKSIGASAFEGCSSLTSLVLPDSVTDISENLLCECTGLSSVVLGSGTVSIGNRSFGGCSGLVSLSIPNTVVKLGEFPFQGCDSLAAVYNFSDLSITPGGYGLPDDAVVHSDKCGGNLLFIYDGSSRTMTVVGSGDMYGYSDLPMPWNEHRGDTDTVVLPDGLTGIGDLSFNNFFKLNRISIPETVESIGNEAFSFCSSLTTLHIPGSVASIGEKVFYGCVSLEEINVDVTNVRYRSQDGILYDIADASLICCPANTPLTSVTVPDSVTSISTLAFASCETIGSVYIPGSVKTIGDLAFYCCKNLSSLTISDGVEHLNDYAFCYCTALSSLTIPDSVTSIGKYTFSDCKGLTSVTLGSGLTSIGNYSFENCVSVTDVYNNSELTINPGDYGLPWDAVIHKGDGEDRPSKDA